MKKIERKAKEQNNDLIYSDLSITAKGFFERHGYVVEKQQFKRSRNKELINFRMTKQNIDINFLTALKFEPLTKNNWNKFVDLFGAKGACGNCWCMWFRLNKTDFDKGKVNDGNKNAMKQLVWDNQPTGLLGFYDGLPVAWCAFAPREHFLKLQKSRIHKPIDNKQVWSVPCIFIAKDFRRQGISVALLKGLVRYAKENGIKIIEAYPTIPTQEKLPDAFAWTGLYKSFERAGFEIVDRTSKNRPMVRYYID